MKKKFFFATVAIVALASCADQEYIGESPSPNPGTGPEETAIVFNSGAKTLTRAVWTGQDAATKLGEEFVFTGIKSDGGSTVPQNFVFDQYTAKWYLNTANSTLSNSNDCEYVGESPATTSTLTGTTQSIKYWDYSATQYDFAAYSTPELTVVTDANNLGSGKVLIDPQDLVAPNSDGFMSYQIKGSAADLKKCYISDLVTHYNLDNSSNAGIDPDAATTFGKVVTFSFRSLATKIRLAFYETVPGYSVKEVKFYASTADNATLSGDDATDLTPKLLTVTGARSLPAQDGNGTMTITFPTKGWANAPENSTNSSNPKTDYNKAHIEFSPASSDATTNPNTVPYLTFDALVNYPKTTEGIFTSTNNDYIGRTTTEASYAGGLVDEDGNTDANGTGKYYTILPNEKPDDELDLLEPLMIHIQYTLVSADGSNEEIVVNHAKAIIPRELANWHPNYAYTYLFKISNMTNGTTGIGPDGQPAMGLTPITLNAVVVDSEDGVQETITTVSDPSITTYMAGKIITTNDEYIQDGDTPIYIIVNDGSDNVTLVTTAGATQNAKLYTVSVDNGAIQTISEQTVHNALRYGAISDNTYTVTDAKSKDLSVTDITSQLSLTNTIAATDSPTGDVITLDASAKKAAKFIPTAGETYVFQYIKTPFVEGEYDEIAPKKLTAGTKYYLSTAGTGEYTADGSEIVYSYSTYYEKVGDNYVLVEPKKLTAGNTYYTSERGAGKFVATGSEVVQETDKYWELKSGSDTPTDGEYMYKIIKVAP